MDLTQLILEQGNKAVADCLGVSNRTLDNLKTGSTALTIDDLYELKNRWPKTDCVKTIQNIGLMRVRKGVNRKNRDKESKRGCSTPMIYR